LYITAEIGELWPRGLGRLNTEVSKKICNAFFVHRLAARDEIWHHEGHWCVAGLILTDSGELWSTFSGAQFFDRTLLVRG